MVAEEEWAAVVAIAEEYDGMAIKNILFDLDGTLLPMDQEIFIKEYFGGLAKKLAPQGYEPKQLIDAIWQGSAAMVQNDGSCTNEEAFWSTISDIYGRNMREEEEKFNAYYVEMYDNVARVCGYDPRAAEAVRRLKSEGYCVVLATNPLFPRIATEKRIRWAGLDLTDFSLVTTYENSSHCKPNLDYYRDIVKELDLDPTECLMVGNDVGEDMIAAALGMKVFLLTDCLINKKGEDIEKYPHGSFPELIEYIEADR